MKNTVKTKENVFIYIDIMTKWLYNWSIQKKSAKKKKEAKKVKTTTNEQKKRFQSGRREVREMAKTKRVKKGDLIVTANGKHFLIAEMNKRTIALCIENMTAILADFVDDHIVLNHKVFKIERVVTSNEN